MTFHHIFSRTKRYTLLLLTLLPLYTLAQPREAKETD